MNVRILCEICRDGKVYPNSGAQGGHFKFRHGQSLSTYEYKKAMQRRQPRAAQLEVEAPGPEVEFEPLEPEVGPSAHESIEVGAEEGLGYSSFINSLLLVLANSPHDPDHAPHDQHYHG